MTHSTQLKLRTKYGKKNPRLKQLQQQKENQRTLARDLRKAERK